MTQRKLISLIVFLVLGASALSPGVAASAPAEGRDAQQAGAKVKYPGIGVEIVRTSGDERLLKGASRNFKNYINARLDELFDEAGSKPRCAKAPTIVIKRYDGRGFASGGEGSYGPCAGGGYAILYKHSASGWEPILGTQDVRYCQDLAFHGVTDFIGGPDCVTEDGKVIRYHLRKTDTASPEASARRVARLVGGFPSVPSEDVLTSAAAEQVAVLIAKEAYVDVDSCVAAGDSDPLADQLGGSPFGCSVTAYKTPIKKGKKQSFLLRMDDDFVVTEIVEL